MACLDDLVDQFNQITRELNSMKVGANHRSNSNILRSQLLNQIIVHKDFDKNQKYFLVPQIKPDLYVCYNIAIVGNSKNLLNHQLGEEIDQHGDVIRFNYFHTDGLEEHCGSKTTIHICGFPAFFGGKPRNHPKINNMDYYFYNKVQNATIVVFYRPSTMLKKIQEHEKKIAYNNNQIHKLDLTHKKYYDTIVRTMGLKMPRQNLQCGSTLMFLIADLGIVPDVYGLDLKYCDDNYYYYWDTVNKKCHKLSSSHNYTDEFYLPNKLNELGIIKIHTFN